MTIHLFTQVLIEVYNKITVVFMPDETAAIV